MKAIIQFLVETIVRLLSKTPTYLMVLQILLALMIGANAVVTHLVAEGILINPAHWIQTLFVGTGAIVPYIIAILTAQLSVKDTAKKEANVAKVVGK